MKNIRTMERMKTSDGVITMPAGDYPIRAIISKVECIFCHKKFDWRFEKLEKNTLIKSERLECPHCQKYFYGVLRFGTI
jgi:DNA-directed RNA polymerase subunit RPC12/RpoP